MEVLGGRFIGLGCEVNYEVQIQSTTHWPNEFLGVSRAWNNLVKYWNISSLYINKSFK